MAAIRAPFVKSPDIPGKPRSSFEEAKVVIVAVHQDIIAANLEDFVPQDKKARVFPGS